MSILYVKKDRRYSQTTVIKVCTFTEENDSDILCFRCIRIKKYQSYHDSLLVPLFVLFAVARLYCKHCTLDKTRFRSLPCSITYFPIYF